MIMLMVVVVARRWPQREWIWKSGNHLFIPSLRGAYFRAFNTNWISILLAHEPAAPQFRDSYTYNKQIDVLMLHHLNLNFNLSSTPRALPIHILKSIKTYFWAPNLWENCNVIECEDTITSLMMVVRPYLLVICCLPMSQRKIIIGFANTRNCHLQATLGSAAANDCVLAWEL